MWFISFDGDDVPAGSLHVAAGSCLAVESLQESFSDLGNQSHSHYPSGTPYPDYYTHNALDGSHGDGSRDSCAFVHYHIHCSEHLLANCRYSEHLANCYTLHNLGYSTDCPLYNLHLLCNDLHSHIDLQ